ncbi:hypothetical protein LEP1GSC068_2110 [Leptospira sp. Fiocruz LV3954]|nr:hypothetical protein LEP1GSC068_2110 [Leptospira sp. Fiocruz LV3954]EMI66721.1 hypothetical protein LEP1GSC076_3177 [Leptospira sp. Fiocruz LV4135]
MSFFWDRFLWEFLQITSPYALFAGLKEFFTIKSRDGDFDFVGVPTFGTGFGFLTSNSHSLKV